MKKILFFLVIVLGSMTAITASAQRVLVVYFSQPEEVKLDGVDAVSGASVLLKNNEVLGSTQYVAQLIQQQTGGDIFRIETAKPYPQQHEPLLKYADQEMKNGDRPILKAPIANLADYDTVFVGYPIWWYKMPMAMYSLFEQHDFSGKTIVPFTTHGGSRFSDSLREIARLQPDARLIQPGLAISRGDVASVDTPSEVINWLNKLPLTP
ncbi:flavodoxin [Serratia fonticola]|uniref:Flavodoxin n=1 Tax=Serratia fonticola TaxID=47917 RepID=A0A559T0I1_SERFO|nr:flavodoxin [Serratia fonticola]TQI79401.1 flavodoxin [Serratia fonticola]TQI98574.1 flavodoxin [Serratia fonticola]TVZ68102.1 flavodoxin [Serratia fonticola]